MFCFVVLLYLHLYSPALFSPERTRSVYGDHVIINVTRMLSPSSQEAIINDHAACATWLFRMIIMLTTNNFFLLSESLSALARAFKGRVGLFSTASNIIGVYTH